ncbi:hypothetical protein BST61_g10150 [Cercospora zeina]
MRKALSKAFAPISTNQDIPPTFPNIPIRPHLLLLPPLHVRPAPHLRNNPSQRTRILHLPQHGRAPRAKTPPRNSSPLCQRPHVPPRNRTRCHSVMLRALFGPKTGFNVFCYLSKAGAKG